MNLAELQKILADQKHPPVHLWEPDNCGDMDMVIKADGTWLYKGSSIDRKPLVKLFSTVLRLDSDNEYYLVTPVEKLRITVDDAPFTAVECDCLVDDDTQRLVFRTNVDELVVAGPEHRLRVRQSASDESPRPYLHVRAGLDALIGRNVFYQLVDLARSESLANGQEQLVIDSDGASFVLGSV